MVWFTKKTEQVNVALEQQETIRSLQKQLDLVMKERDQLIDRFQAQAEAAPLYVDMVKMNVFSVERRDEHTIIGWIFNNGTTSEVREWWIVTSLETHDRLVTEFIATINQNG